MDRAINMFSEPSGFDKNPSFTYAGMGSFVNYWKSGHFCKYISGPGQF
jgi:hypothetical protein